MALGLSAAPLAGAVASDAADVEPCTGSPRPITAELDYVFEGELVPELLGVNCLALDQTLSGARIDWGDGATSPGKVTYRKNPDGVTQQAWIEARHSYLALGV